MSKRSPFDLTGRTALVTGGNQGLGLAFAFGLADAGAQVAIAGRSAERNAKVVAGVVIVVAVVVGVVLTNVAFSLF